MNAIQILKSLYDEWQTWTDEECKWDGEPFIERFSWSGCSLDPFALRIGDVVDYTFDDRPELLTEEEWSSVEYRNWQIIDGKKYWFVALYEKESPGVYDKSHIQEIVLVVDDEKRLVGIVKINGVYSAYDSISIDGPEDWELVTPIPKTVVEWKVIK